MNTSDFDNVALHIPKYGELLHRLPDDVKAQAFDIRLRARQPLAVCGREGVFFLREDGTVCRGLTNGLLRVSMGEMQEIFVQSCAHSVFSHEHEIRKGYIQMSSGCRVGLCGTAVLEKGQVKSVRDITSLVFRIPRDVRGCADRLFLEGVDLRKGLLVAGEPSSGKTTLLRDLAASLSSGKFQPASRVAVLDERGEIGGEFDLGPCADVLLGYPKERAFDVAIRMLSPQYIICDELSPEDLDTVRKAALSGVGLIASVHAGREELYQRPLCRELLRTGAFGAAACLVGRAQPGEIETIEYFGGEECESNGDGPGAFVRAWDRDLESGGAQAPGGAPP